MVLTIHHLGISQSERILWLCEELGLPYTLVKHVRAPVLAPESLKSLPGNPLGRAPFIEDSATGVTLSESGAVVEYIIHRYGGGRLSVGPEAEAKAYAEYLYWFHFANATLQPALQVSMFIGLARLDDGAMVQGLADKRLHVALKQLDDRLGESQWLAGAEFTAADIMTVYCISTQRYYGLGSLAGYENVLRYLGECGGREGYRRAMEKGDPEMEPLLGAEAPGKSIIEVGGTESDVWKKKK
ncbi:hypothetical protein B0A54_15719 [Friedmanniomyces endolithicus]|uniref:Glutathione S-transferase 3 n=1 Tax=Friedmanniomyces endolithicus TaxID=329885 RepID=A0A4U0UAU8_9PEZI|nr:hypothetical protein LTS09_013416 [Friedmanniomyces endolithicus]KAK0304088.1 hypothetical protein LTR01_007705 [Friedmanniomyces endolithicus]KAK0826776.1 hypothetical protein LTR73_006110 [Friedmanniomyces endolithicus]TKA31586.1 hypothetical protein B0A54_15719 [Friedmanniomyces endolithicus]